MKRLSFSFWSAVVLSACGGNNTKTDNLDTTDPSNPDSTGELKLQSSPSAHQGYVIDGYIENARVFRDENGNKVFDPDEKYVITNSKGYLLD